MAAQWRWRACPCASTKSFPFLFGSRGLRAQPDFCSSIKLERRHVDRARGRSCRRANHVHETRDVATNEGARPSGSGARAAISSEPRPRPSNQRSAEDDGGEMPDERGPWNVDRNQNSRRKESASQRASEHSSRAELSVSRAFIKQYKMNRNLENLFLNIL